MVQLKVLIEPVHINQYYFQLLISRLMETLGPHLLLIIKKLSLKIKYNPDYCLAA